MKKCISVLMMAWLVSFSLQAQIVSGTDTLYGHEWLQGEAARVKVPVAADGWYRITYESLQAQGWPLESIMAEQFRLFHHGVEVPYYVTQSEGMPLQSGDYLLFYGRKNRGELDSLLYRDAANQQLNPAYSIITDTASYFLTWRDTPGLRYAAIENDWDNPPVVASYIWREAEQVNTGSFAKEYYRFSGATLHYSHFGIGEGYGNRTINQLLGDGSTTQEITLALPGLYPSGPSARLQTRYVAALFEHDQRLRVNGTELRRDSFTIGA
ncbi:MAG: hypothetical protein R2795_09020 [Saprospiraceae bacterium]